MVQNFLNVSFINDDVKMFIKNESMSECVRVSQKIQKMEKINVSRDEVFQMRRKSLEKFCEKHKMGGGTVLPHTLRIVLCFSKYEVGIYNDLYPKGSLKTFIGHGPLYFSVLLLW